MSLADEIYSPVPNLFLAGLACHIPSKTPISTKGQSLHGGQTSLAVLPVELVIIILDLAAFPCRPPRTPGADYALQICNFALSLDAHSFRLTAAVLVLSPMSEHRRPLTSTPHELVQTARQYSFSRIMFYYEHPWRSEPKFWDELVRSRDNVWTAAEKQMDERNLVHHPLLQAPGYSVL
ncbi:hypothetical protein C8F04DRAFT_1247544 [Mycena alexandri]|uniref:Uncharacterized protein n=1 Tax=Mycena alexandri TaxID=1745969 RepID=A0AAD6TJT1_9AGAR|nr:hypothetical protein C8F04DRAFT_1247544 [Mycena alexandri]